MLFLRYAVLDMRPSMKYFYSDEKDPFDNAKGRWVKKDSFDAFGREQLEQLQCTQ